MKYSDESYNLRIELDTENFDLNPKQIEQLERSLSPLRESIEVFPFANLYATMQYKPPSRDYRVKAVLRLPGAGLATGDLDEHVLTAFRRCADKLVHKVSAYKHRLENSEGLAKHEKGTRHDIVARRAVDGQALQAAVDQGDYAEFRKLLFPFEEPVRKRAGRWIQRYPMVQAQLGNRFTLADIVEEVLLNAFERFASHSREVPFGDWLENLIDPSIKLISDNPDGELANISFARSAAEMDR